jgi:RND family efflux transporter MFP subunit
MPYMKTQLNHAAAIPIMMIAIILPACSHNEKGEEKKVERPVAVQVAAPVQQVGEKITLSGQVQPCETTFISPRMMGYISRILVKPGDRVYRGQLLVTISNEDIAAKRAQAEAMVSEADAALNDAAKDYERFKKLHQQQSASQKELESAMLRYQSTKAKVEAVRQLENEADAMLAYSSLVAPYKGVITQKFVDQGGMANPGMPILAMERLDSYHVRAFVSENEIDKVKTGMNVRVIIKSTGKTFTGKVSEISPSSQFTGGQFQIKVSVPDSETDGLFSGMYANVNVCMPYDSGVQNLYVPLSAIIRRDQLTGIYTVREDQTAQLRWLKVGRESDGQVEVLSGLNPNEKFITQSESRLYSGIPVSVK